MEERYGAEWQRDHQWEFEREAYYDYRDTEETPLMWCRDCKEPVNVHVTEEYERMDGRTYCSGVYYECPEDGYHRIEDIAKCPICGGYMGESDEYCQDCMDEVNQWLTEMRDGLKLDQNTFEDIVCRVLDI